MKEHNGEITASNHLQGGAIFQIRLPFGAGIADRGLAQAVTDPVQNSGVRITAEPAPENYSSDVGGGI
jgi:hypothetical protein